MNKNIYSTLLLAGVCLTGCNPFKSSPKVILPDTQPLEAGKLGSTVQTCKKEIDDLEGRSAYVPKERRKEFDKVVSMASDACDELTTTYERLKSASHQEKTYHQNVQHARSTMLEGQVESAAVESHSSDSGSSTDYGSFTSQDVTPPDSAAGSSISDEPLS